MCVNCEFIMNRFSICNEWPLHVASTLMEPSYEASIAPQKWEEREKLYLRMASYHGTLQVSESPISFPVLDIVAT